MDFREKTISEETVYKGSILTVFRRIAELPDGTAAGRDVIRVGKAAAAVPVDEIGNVVLVRQYRCGIDDFTLEIPAGKADHAGESLMECAARELEEETGLHAGRLEPLPRILSAPAFCNECVSLFLATELTQGTCQPDEGEYLQPVRIPLEQAVQGVMNGEYPDAKTALGILTAFKKLKG